MTTLIYNDVILRDCETKLFNQSIQMDPSGTDLMYSKFRIRVSSTVVATSYPNKSFGVSVSGEATPSANAIERVKIIHALLSEPRKDFWFIISNAVNNEQMPVASKTRDEAYIVATGSPEGVMDYNPYSAQPLAEIRLLNPSAGRQLSTWTMALSRCWLTFRRSLAGERCGWNLRSKFAGDFAFQVLLT